MPTAPIGRKTWRRDDEAQCWLPANIAVPPWWPKDTYDKRPITFVYRILRRDLDDLNKADHPAKRMDKRGDEFAFEVLKAVGKGSHERSPFWHATKSLHAAHQWRTKAETSKDGVARVGSQPSGGNRVAIRIDLWEWWQSGKMPEDALIDLSNIKAQQFFPEAPW